LINPDLLTANKVAMIIDVSTKTLSSWYKWYNTYDVPLNCPLLPDYQQASIKGRRYWDKADIPLLLAFKEYIPKGRNGVMGNHNAQYWGDRGKRALQNKLDLQNNKK
jgi:hypothetical protein